MEPRLRGDGEGARSAKPTAAGQLKHAAILRDVSSSCSKEQSS